MSIQDVMLSIDTTEAKILFDKEVCHLLLVYVHIHILLLMLMFIMIIYLFFMHRLLQIN